MRAAIVLLVVLNLGAAAWWLLHAPPSAEAAATPPPGAARLHLAPDPGTGARTPAVQAQATVPVAPTPAVAAQAPTRPMQAQSTAPTDTHIRAQTEPAADDTGAASAAIACEGGNGSADGWRVYLPRLPSADAARATASRIGEAGFSDYLVVADGADANTIALGRYGTRSAAQRRTAALRAAGFPARCARIPAATPA
jgi:hypothetical protein